MADPKLEFEISGNLIVDAIFMPTGIRIGDASSGEVTQNSSAIAIGNSAGFEGQSNNAIAIGLTAGHDNQGEKAIAIGLSAGRTNQDKFSIAIGEGAGHTDQNKEAVAIGYNAGEKNQGLKAVALGNGAGRFDQYNNSIAIGNNAGNKKLGDKSIAIGWEAEFDNSSANVTQNVIVLNATDSSLNSDVSSAFFMKPLRDVSDNVSPATDRNNFKIMVYDANRGEIAYDSSYNGTGNIDLTNVTAETVTAETVKVSKSFFLTSVTYTDASLSDISNNPTPIALNTPVILFNIDSSNNFYTDISNQGTEGQTLDIFVEINMTRTVIGSVRVYFRNVVSGGGIYSYLTFNNTGQSASLIYVDNKWRIRNCGALPSTS